MKCVRCKVGDTRVVDTRSDADGFQVKRRRRCGHCGHRFFTYESVHSPAAYRAKRIRQRARHRELHRDRINEKQKEHARSARAAEALGVTPAEVRAMWADSGGDTGV